MDSGLKVQQPDEAVLKDIVIEKSDSGLFQVAGENTNKGKLELNRWMGMFCNESCWVSTVKHYYLVLFWAIVAPEN